MLHDGYRNLVANLGTDRDKAYHGSYVLNLLDAHSLLTIYRSAWLPQAIVDIPALDAVRNWRSWQAKPDQITQLEAEERRLGLREKTRDALKAARLYGGAGILMLDGSSDPTKPLNPERIRKGGLKGLVVVTPMQISPGEIERDPESPFYGRPAYYSLSTGTKAAEQIHPSRLAVFDGVPVPDAATVSTGWGDSVLLAAMDAINHADGFVANVAALAHEAKIDVIHIPRLMEMLASGQEAAITERLMLGMRNKGTNGALVLDGGGTIPGSSEVRGKEEYEQKSASFSGLDALWDRFMMVVSGATKLPIPVSRIFGRSAAGMNATGDGDERVYFDGVKAMQELEVGPAMAALDECLIRSALGARPAEIFYAWRPLRQETEETKAKVFKMVADAARVLAGPNGMILPEEAISEAVANRLIEDGSLPGLEAAMEKYNWLPDDSDGSPGQSPDGSDSAVVTDSAPRTLYVSRKVLNAGEIIRWAKSQGFGKTLNASDLHVTVAFSRTPVDWMECGESWQGRVEVEAGGPRQMERFGEARVLLFASNDLHWRHERFKEAGASWDHPQYQPHITISYDPEAPSIDDIEPYQGPIILGPEIFAEVQEDWAARIEETE
ncbi:hypothetical protein C4N9_20860 [Pararhodobacter marinus]|uniref:Anti-CBASS protein Acb1 n=2 Tax=Pararhodobacter marinus TaxID=2184063 RepID=A0A2U2C4D1_9RHOB|nr:hypothetical protein C4N9_20860 [Pararhodobacter marinus]